MKLGKFYILCLSLSLTIGCSEDKPSQVAVASQCHPEDQSLDKDRVITETYLQFTRVFAPYQHLDCNGKVTRISNETVKEPKETYIYTPKTSLGASGEIGRHAYNRTTCHSGTFKESAGSRKEQMSIKMHTSPGTDRMEVDRRRKNYIDYEFFECAEPLGGPIAGCKKFHDLERGTLVLEIKYREEFQEKVRDQNDCPSKP